LELQTQLLIARRIEYLSAAKAEELGRSSEGIGRGLNALINKFHAKADVAGREGLVVSRWSLVAGEYRPVAPLGTTIPKRTFQRLSTNDQRLHYQTLHAF